MKKILVMLFLCITLCGCNSKVDIEKIMSENEYIIIDVRTKEEYDENHIVDSINIPYDVINETIDIDKNKVIFVYCRSGNRSNIALGILKKLGYTVYDLGAFEEINLPKIR